MGGSQISSPPEHPWEGLGTSTSSLASENPYATIKELPPVVTKAHEGSYMEMKSPVQREMSYAEIGLLEEPPQEGRWPWAVGTQAQWGGNSLSDRSCTALEAGI